MPYIAQEGRHDLDDLIDPLVNKLVEKYTTATKIVGPLNYVLSRIFLGTLTKLTKLHPEEKGYGTLAAFGGVLSHMGMEIYRRVTVSYEENKIMDNGDLPEMSE